MADIVISGYHGFRNSGDEALLFAILNTLRKKNPALTFTVLSKTPEETARAYGVHAVSRYDFFAVRREMKKAKMLLFGGGSLLQDATSSKSVLYYLAVLRLAQKCGLKTMLYANGVGPILKKRNRALAARILNRTDLITLRDDKSDEELRALGVTSPKTIITADPAFTLDASLSLSGEYFLHMAGVPKKARLMVVSIREWKENAADFSAEMAAFCDDMAERHGLVPLFVPMQYPADVAIAEEVAGKMRHEAYHIRRELSVPEMFAVLSEAEVLVGMRLHSLIYATTLAVPAMAIVYDPKISAFMESLCQPECADAAHFSARDAAAMVDRILEEYEKRKEMLRARNEDLRRMAEENATYALRLLAE